MKILFVLSRFPHPLDKGDKLRAFHQIRMLSQQNEVHLIALNDEKVNQEGMEALKQYCKTVECVVLPAWKSKLNLMRSFFNNSPFQVNYFYSRAMYKAIERIVKDEQIEVVMGQLVRVVENIPKGLGVHYHLDYMDAFSKNMERRFHHSTKFEKRFVKREKERLVEYEKAVAARFDSLSMIAEPDAAVLQKELKKVVEVIPNGISDYFLNYKELGIEDKEYDIIFTGNMGYHPNIQACKYLIYDLLPMITERFRPIKICLAGTSPTQEVKDFASENVVVTGFVEDLRPYLAKSRLFVAPLFGGSGLQNKLLESLAMGLPTLTTRLANNALKATPKEHILVCNDKEAFTKQVIRLLQNPESAKSLGQNGKVYIEKHFSWQTFNTKLENILKG